LTIRRYWGVAHVRWELPFPLRLPPHLIDCWEPLEGVGRVLFRPEVGSVQWSRSTNLLRTADLFGDLGPPEDPAALPSHFYRVNAVMPSGKEYTALSLSGGADGGFREVHPYSVANVFLCLRSKEQFQPTALADRAAAAINNVLRVHRFLVFDGASRDVDPALDSYCTVFSLAHVPGEWPQSDPHGLLMRLQELPFGTTAGIDRHHKIGIGSAHDLSVSLFDDGTMAKINRLVVALVELVPYQELLLSAVRRLLRNELAFAVIDAESAVEACIVRNIRAAMLADGSVESEIDLALDSRLGSLQQRITQMDKLAQKAGFARFEHSDVERTWRADLYRRRNDIVHKGIRQLDSDSAALAVTSAFNVVSFVEEQFPGHVPPLIWARSTNDLRTTTTNKGKIFQRFLGR
jgi:hypothetical protein